MAHKYQIYFVEKEQIPAIWDDIKPELEKVLHKSHGEEAIQDVKKGLEDGSRGLILAFQNGDLKMTVTVAFIDYPQIRALRVLGASGKDHRDWVPALTQFLEMWAIEQGFDRLEGFMRDGWQKAIKPLGWEKGYTLMIKDIEDGRR